MHKRIIEILGCMFLATSAHATKALSIDKVMTSSFELSFPNEYNVQPDSSDFNVLNYILMSNEEGERWVVISIRNKASGTRSLNHKHLLSLLASGERVHPQEFKQSFGANETLSLTLRLAESIFPVLEVYSREKK
jgi:hypothetical protein